MKPRRFIDIVQYLFWFTDTTFIRLLLAVSALVFAFGIWVPGHFLDTARFAMMEIVPYQDVWASLFMLYFCGVSWRFIDSTRRVRWALAVNVLGSALWLTSAFTMYAAQYLTLTTAVEGALGILSLWVLYRTGLTPELVTP